MSEYPPGGRSAGMTLFREAGLGTPRDSEMCEGPTDMCEDRDPCLFWEAVQTEHETLCLLTTCLPFLPAGGTARQQAPEAGCVRPGGAERERSPAGVWEDMWVPGLSVGRILRRAQAPHSLGAQPVRPWACTGACAPGPVLPAAAHGAARASPPTPLPGAAGVLADLVRVSGVFPAI